MRHSYPINRKETFYYKYIEPVLKAIAMSAIVAFIVLICLTAAGKI